MTLPELSDSRPSDTEANRFLLLCRQRDYAEAAAELRRVKFRVQYSSGGEWRAWCDAAESYLARKSTEATT